MQRNTIGVAGCGTMGLPMAQCLLAAGFDVRGFDVRAVDEFGDFASYMEADPGKFAASVDVLISVVRDIAQTEDLLFNDQAMLKGPNPPTVLVVSSTLSPRYVLELKDRLPATVEMMDAPMSGAPYRAREGDLSFMLGGRAALVNELLPLFQAMGSQTPYLGPVGHGMTIKVLNNYCAATGLVATRRVLEMARHLGIEPGSLLGVMRNSSGSNWYGDNITSIDWSAQGYAPDNTIGIVEKDVKSALDAIQRDPTTSENKTRHWQLDDALLEGLRQLGPIDIDALKAQIDRDES